MHTATPCPGPCVPVLPDVMAEAVSSRFAQVRYPCALQKPMSGKLRNYNINVIYNYNIEM